MTDHEIRYALDDRDYTETIAWASYRLNEGLPTMEKEETIGLVFVAAFKLGWTSALVTRLIGDLPAPPRQAGLVTK